VLICGKIGRAVRHVVITIFRNNDVVVPRARFLVTHDFHVHCPRAVYLFDLPPWKWPYHHDSRTEITTWLGFHHVLLSWYITVTH